MLPFLKPKSVAGVIISHRLPDGGDQEEGTEGNENNGLDAAAADLIRAVHAKDEKGVCDALRAAHQILDSEEPEQDESPMSDDMSGE